MVILLAVGTGMMLGYILERGDFCFHSTLRGIVRRPPEYTLLCVYLLTMLVATPLVQALIALGWITPWVPPFAWRANVVGGLFFGAGMVIAATCVTGLFYKLGHGMLGTVVGLAAWAVGDLVGYQGALAPVRERLNADVTGVDDRSATVLNLLGAPAGIGLLVVLGGVALIFLWRSPLKPRAPLWDWRRLGLSMGVFTSVAWLLAQAGGSNYTFGTSGVPTALFNYITAGEALQPWIPVTLFSIIPGAVIAALLGGTMWVRGESMRRYAGLAAGGFVMGAAASISGGCNLGHSMVGVPLLSMGSITTTISMLVGVWLAVQIGKLWPANRMQAVEATKGV